MRAVASRIFLLALLLSCFSASADELEFSHQLHLGKVGLDCNVCHSSVSSSDEATDHNLPERALCLACHNGQTAPEIDASPLADREPAERSFWFSHEQHLALEANVAGRIAEAIDSGEYLGPVPDIRDQLNPDNACSGCHRGLESGPRRFSGPSASDGRLPGLP